MAEDFRVIRAKRDGLPALILIDGGLGLSQSRRYPWFVVVTILVAAERSDGLCDESESNRLNDIEDSLLDSLPESSYLYVGHLTWNSRRQIMMYLSREQPEFLREQLAQIGQPLAEVEWIHDPDWAEYLSLSGR